MKEPLSLNTFRSREFIRLTRMLCDGGVVAVHEELKRDRQLTDSEKRELDLQAAFQAGQMIPAPKSNAVVKTTWHLLTLFGVVRRICETLLLGILAVVRLVDYRGKFFLRLHASWFPEIIHLRYVNFQIGLVHSYLLSALCPRTWPIDRAFLEGITGHFWGMSGRLDVSRRWMKRSADLLEALAKLPEPGSDLEFYAWHLKIEVQSILALHMAYAGDQLAAQETFGIALAQMEARPYIWFEIFARTMRQYSSLDMLNDTLLQTDAIALKRRLGDLFISKYALRTTAYAGLLAAVRGDFRTAYLQLLNADSFYEKTPIKVELGRYHCIRALTELELGDPGAAVAHARMAQSFYSNIPGGKFHKCDSLIFDVEVRIRGYLQGSGGRPSLDEIRSLKKSLRQARRLVRGSPGIAVRIDALSLLIQFVSGQFAHDGVSLRVVRERLVKCSPRLDRVLAQIDHDGPNATHAGINHRNKIAADMSLNMIKDVLGVFSAEDPIIGGMEVFRGLFGAESAEIFHDEQGKKGDSTHLSFGEFVRELPSGDVVVAIALPKENLSYRLNKPINRLQFDGYLLNAVELCARLIQSIIVARESTLNAAVANTTQMLAHDIRKPFAMLNVGIALLARASTPTEMKQILAYVHPEIDRAIKSVNGLLADVMDVGSNANELSREAICPETLIQDSLRDVFTVFPKAGASILYDLQHSHMVMVNTQKVMRVFGNIVLNVLEAMPTDGAMWFTTHEQDGMVEFCIGNRGPIIPPEVLTKLFNAFFTKGKRGGTGLGLAIAQKIIHLHGGKIWCESSATPENPGGQVEFFFTLPIAAGNPSNFSGSLPVDSASLSIETFRHPSEKRKPHLSLQ